MAPKVESEHHELSPLLNIPLEIQVDQEPLITRIKSEFDELLVTAFPSMQSMVLAQLPWIISLRFVGGIGNQELAAAALATTLCNVTGMSFSVGLSSALSTLAGQAKGELLSRTSNQTNTNANKDPNQSTRDPESTVETLPKEPSSNEELITPLVFLMRGLMVQLGIVIPIGIWWMYGIKDLLVALGQGNALAGMTEDYIRILVPGLWGFSVTWTLTAWVQSIGMADVPVYAAALGLALHVPMNWFFIDVVGLGYKGCAVATACYNLIPPVVILVYLFGLERGRERVLACTGALAIGRSSLSFQREFTAAVMSLSGIVQYIALGLPGIVMISEWWASELAIFLSGRLEPAPADALGGMSIYQSINSFSFMFPMAISIAGSARVSMLLGAGFGSKAKFAAEVSVGCTAVVGAILCLLLLTIPHWFLPSLFAPNEPEVILQTSRTIPLLAVYVFADAIQTGLSGVVKGCGRQWVTMPVIVVAYWVVGAPLAYYLSFIRHGGVMYCEGSYFCGDVGLVAGMTTGTWVHMLLLAVAVVTTTNWETEALKAKQRVGDDH